MSSGVLVHLTGQLCTSRAELPARLDVTVRSTLGTLGPTIIVVINVTTVAMLQTLCASVL